MLEYWTEQHKKQIQEEMEAYRKFLRTTEDGQYVLHTAQQCEVTEEELISLLYVVNHPARFIQRKDNNEP
jgi:hypothetical protein